MKLDLMSGAQSLRAMQQLSRHAQDSGYSGLVITEAGRTAYLSCAAAALASDLDILTGIAVAFPRSPMVTAASAWELAEAADGRFRLGLGTQVRAHIERRYGAPFDPPGPRMRDYLRAVRACFAAFRGDAPLDHHGPFYDLSLLPKMWSAGPISVGDPPIDLAAVNPWMLRLAGELADGVHIHPLNTPAYIRDTVQPALEEGAARSARSLEDFEMIVPAFLAVGDTDAEQHHLREVARMQIAFYGSTPNYAFIFEQIGFDGTTQRLREHAGDLDAMTSVISDDVLDHFVITARWDNVAAAIIDRYAGIATRVVNYFGAPAWSDDPQSLTRWGHVARELAHE